MRLTAQENKAVCDLLKGVDPNGRLYLFGSRTDNTKKGGDMSFSGVLPECVNYYICVDEFLSEHSHHLCRTYIHWCLH